jgi:hypothetical protein
MTIRDRDRIRFVTQHFNDLQGLRYWVPVGLMTLSGVACWVNRPLVAVALSMAAFLLMFGARRYYRATLGEVEREPDAELRSLSVFSPAGLTSRLEGFQRMPPAVQRFLSTIGLAFVLFFFLQAMSPTIMTVESPSFQQYGSTLDSIFEFAPSWTRRVTKIPMGLSAAQPLFAQTMYVLFGSFFLGLWLWRERRPSQSYPLALAILLLGLSAFGGALGMFAWENHEVAVRIINFFLPAVVLPWVALLLCGASMILAGLLDHRQLVRGLGRLERT